MFTNQWTITPNCDSTPPTDPHYLNQPNYTWPLELSSGFSHLRPEVFHISLPTHKIHNRGGGRKEEQTIGLGLAPRARGVWQFCAALRAFAGYRACISTKPLGLLTPVLALVIPASVGQHVIAAAFRTSVEWSPLCPTLISWLTCSVDWSLLLPSADCSVLPTVSGTFLPSVSWDISRAGPLCGFRAKTDKGIVGLAPKHTHTTNAQNRVTKWYL